MLQAAKRAGAAISNGGGQEDRCRTDTPSLQTLVRLIRTTGGCLTATPNRAGCAGSRIASGAGRPLGVVGCAGGCGAF
jgi:hypothetical protein